MDYAEFDAARRRIVHAWGREITDPQVLAAAVEQLRAQAATIPAGTPAEQRARVEAAIAEITRIAYAAPTIGERDAALEMNESLVETIDVLDRGPGD